MGAHLVDLSANKLLDAAIADLHVAEADVGQPVDENAAERLAVRWVLQMD